MLQLDRQVPVPQERTTGRAVDLDAAIGTLLDASSRTFALTIPLLPGPLRREVGLAYLLLRAADGIEDATGVDRDLRVELLGRFGALLQGAGNRDVVVSDCKVFAVQIPEGGERQVLQNVDILLEALDRLSHQAALRVQKHCARVVVRMLHWLKRETDGSGIHLEDMGELHDYMYSVAGIVGELLTDLFVIHSPTSPRLALMARAADFGAALQLTNIIKDAAEDAELNRHFLPESWNFVGNPSGQASLNALIGLALIRLQTAVDYTCRLPADETGIRLFCLVPVVLALGTLEALALRADETIAGEAIKISRVQVMELVVRAQSAVDDNELIRVLHEDLKGRVQAQLVDEVG